MKFDNRTYIHADRNAHYYNLRYIVFAQRASTQGNCIPSNPVTFYAFLALANHGYGHKTMGIDTS